MNSQINVRLSEELLIKVQEQTKKFGFSSIQEFIRETIREKVFGESLSNEELKLVKRLTTLIQKTNAYGTETELFEKL
ncbi:MAG: ribbon-helix-helix domain-containing protein [Candidatus Nanoarchaeia archaeon]|nr:ribbon-helix-helix domain-containing protein [Candidatus Nanoarchaeia archaeon]